jgi:hypothetical protein
MVPAQTARLVPAHRKSSFRLARSGFDQCGRLSRKPLRALAAPHHPLISKSPKNQFDTHAKPLSLRHLRAMRIH